MQTNESFLRLVNLILAKEYQERKLIKHDWQQYGNFFFGELKVCNEIEKSGTNERVNLTIVQGEPINNDYLEHPYTSIREDFERQYDNQPQ